MLEKCRLSFQLWFKGFNKCAGVKLSEISQVYFKIRNTGNTLEQDFKINSYQSDRKRRERQHKRFLRQRNVMFLNGRVSQPDLRTERFINKQQMKEDVVNVWQSILKGGDLWLDLEIWYGQSAPDFSYN